MFRIALRLVGGLVVLLLAATGSALAWYRPRLWSGGTAPASRRASPAEIEATIKALPPFRSARHPAAVAATEALVTHQLEQLGWSVERQVVVNTRHPDLAPTANLIATHRKPRTSHATVVAAHLDSVSVSPGADDDGSGVALLLELARTLRPDAADDVALCFFSDEEGGLAGSTTYVGSLGRAGWLVDRAYVLDMVGGFNAAPHSQQYPPPMSWLAPDTADFLAVIALPDADGAVQALERARQSAAPELKMVLFEPSRLLANAFPDIWRSDHAPFWRAGIPAVFITDTGEFRSDRYHTARDDASGVDFARVAQLTDALLAVLESDPDQMRSP